MRKHVASWQLCLFAANRFSYGMLGLPTSPPINHALPLHAGVARVGFLPRCRIYIDGEEDGEALLPKHMLTPGGMVKNVLDSQHPYANNVDR